jgi:hypothetical protein
MMIASSICSRSWRNSASILFTSIPILASIPVWFGHRAKPSVPFSEHRLAAESPYKVFVAYFSPTFKRIVPKTEQDFCTGHLDERY